MNDRWFNFAIAITIFTIMANGFLLLGALQPDQNGNVNPLFAGMSNNKLNANQLKTNSNITLNTNGSLSTDSSNTPTSEQGFTPAVTSNDNTNNPGMPAPLQIWDYAQLGAIGFETIMQKLSMLFSIGGIPNPIFLALAGIGYFAKLILGSYLFSVFLRPIFGRVW